MVQPAGDAVVEERHSPVGTDEEVSAVEVSVEDAEKRRPLEEGDHQRPHHSCSVDPGRVHPGDIVEGEAAEPLHHQNPPRHQARVGPRDHYRALIGRDQHSCHVEHVVGLEAEVQLLDDRLREQLHQRRGVGQGGYRYPADQIRGDPAHGRQVPFDASRNGRPLHLHHHLLAASQRRSVHLGNGSGSERLALEGREHHLQ